MILVKRMMSKFLIWAAFAPLELRFTTNLGVRSIDLANSQGFTKYFVSYRFDVSYV